MQGEGIHPDASQIKQPDRFAGSYYFIHKYRFPQDGEMCRDRGGTQQCGGDPVPYEQRKCTE